MLDERFEAFVFGDDVESGVRVLGGEEADIIRDVKVQGVLACALDANVIGSGTEFLELVGEVEWDFALVRTAKHCDLEWGAAEVCQVLWLNVLEVDEYEVGFHFSDVF